MKNDKEVFKNNNLVLDGVFSDKWGVNEFRIMNSLLFKLDVFSKQEKNQFNQIMEKGWLSISYKDLAETMKISLTKAYIQEITKSLTIIRDTGFYIVIDGGRSYTSFIHRFSDLEHYGENDRNRFVKIQLDIELWEKMLEQKNFTILDTKYNRLSSRYQIQLVKLLLRHKGLKNPKNKNPKTKIELTLNELNERFATNYKHISKFKNPLVRAKNTLIKKCNIPNDFDFVFEKSKLVIRYEK